MSVTTVALVRLDQVAFHPHNVRQDLGDLRGLTASIKRHGIMQPVVVEKHNGRLRLRAGHRRTAAARLAGLTRIPAVIHDEALEDDEWLIASVQENVHRQQLSKVERKRTVQALLDLGCTKEGIGEAFGVEAGTVSSWMRSEDRAARASSTRSQLSKTELARRIADWRARGVDVDVVLTELEQFAVKQPSPAGLSPEAKAKASGTVQSKMAAKIEAVEELLESGQSVYVIAEKLGSTVEGFGAMLGRQDRHDLARPFWVAAKHKPLRAVAS